MSEFVDADAYTGNKDSLSFEFIVYEHIRRVARLASKEFHGGKMIIREDAKPNFSVHNEAFYIESASEAYTHSVECLMDLLLPYADEQLISFEKENDKEVEAIWAKHEAAIKNKNRRWYEDNKEFTMRDVAYARRKLFREALLFLRRKNFFEGSSYEEGVLI